MQGKICILLEKVYQIVVLLCIDVGKKVVFAGLCI